MNKRIVPSDQGFPPAPSRTHRTFSRHWKRNPSATERPTRDQLNRFAAVRMQLMVARDEARGFTSQESGGQR